MSKIRDLRVTYRVKIAEWRVDDQNNPDNQEWSLWVFDKVQQKWIQTVNLNRPGEAVWVEDVTEL